MICCCNSFNSSSISDWFFRSSSYFLLIHFVFCLLFFVFFYEFRVEIWACIRCTEKDLFVDHTHHTHNLANGIVNAKSQTILTTAAGKQTPPELQSSIAPRSNSNSSSNSNSNSNSSSLALFHYPSSFIHSSNNSLLCSWWMNWHV